MSTDRTGLLPDAERGHVDKRLELLDQESISDGDELLLVSGGIEHTTPGTSW